MSSITIHQYKLGPMDNFIYFIEDQETDACAVVDPAWDKDWIKAKIKEHNWTLNSILLTHGHPDHVNAVEPLFNDYHVPIYLSAKEDQRMKPENVPISPLNDQDSITIGNSTLTCIHTPGHSPGGICFYQAPHLIAGDTLFVNACGRCDLPGSNPEAMYDSLEIIKTLPDDTIIYPGHDYGPTKTDTLKNQKNTNPYLTAKNKEEFLRKRLGL